MTKAKNSGGIPGAFPELDRLIHEPSRLIIIANLYVLESADFTFLVNQTGLTRGNLSSHMIKLEEAGYVKVKKKFVGRKPLTVFKLTDRGRAAFIKYRQSLQQVLEEIPE